MDGTSSSSSVAVQSSVSFFYLSSCSVLLTS
jgi:hypothetical protein